MVALSGYGAHWNFSADITRWVQRTKIRGDTIMRYVGLNIFFRILLLSPVREGRFRGSNRIGINRRDLSVEPEPKKKRFHEITYTASTGRAAGAKFGSPPTGGETGYMHSKMSEVNWEDTLFFTNNLPYAKPLEDGASPQNDHRPDGIYGAAYDEVKSGIQRIILLASKR